MGEFIKYVTVATVTVMLIKKATEKFLDKLEKISPKILNKLSVA